VNLHNDSWRASQRRCALQYSATAKPIVDMAQGSRKTRKSGGALSSAIERKIGNSARADRLAPRVSKQLDRLDVDIPEQACRLSGSTFGKAVAKPGILL
jgi:hypothetical protein